MDRPCATAIKQSKNGRGLTSHIGRDF